MCGPFSRQVVSRQWWVVVDALLHYSTSNGKNDTASNVDERTARALSIISPSRPSVRLSSFRFLPQRTMDSGLGARPKKRKVSGAKDAEGPDKKRRTARVSRVPAAPPSIDIVTTHPALGECDVQGLAARLISDDPECVSWALNALMKASADGDANYCLGFGGEKVISALCQLFDETIGWEEPDESERELDFHNLQPNISHWGPSSLSGKHEQWRNLCRKKLASPLASSSDPINLIDETEAQILTVVLAIMRNLSFVAQNLRFLVHSESALRILTGALYYRGYFVGTGGETHENGENLHSALHHSNICVYSIQTLINMAPLIDITGRQMFIDLMLLESDEKEIKATVPHQTSQDVDDSEFPSYGVASRLGFGGMHCAKEYDGRAESIDAISDDVVFQVVGSHVEATLAIFPALAAVMDPNDINSVSASASGWHRPSIQSMLDLFLALVENNDNRGIFMNVPDCLLHQLTEMLYLQGRGPESLDYIDPVKNNVNRVVAVKLTVGYDASVDTDLMDRACELLVKLTEVSPNIRKRLGMATSISRMAQRDHTATSLSGASRRISPSILQTDASSSTRRMNIRLYDCLLSMISTSTGRGDAGLLAAQLLSNMATVPENKAGILYVERKLITMSASNPEVSNVACNGIFNRI